MNGKMNSGKIKIGITTLYTGSTNYGGVLQAYAMCKALENLGFEAYQILYKKDPISAKERLVRTIQNKRLLSMMKIRINLFIVSIQEKIHHSTQSLREFRNSFSEFREMIPHSEKLYTDKTITDCTIYDVYLTGSDQVWNIGETYEIEPFYWLEFVDSNKRKISYAASISKKDFPKYLYPKIQSLLADYRAISVREKTDKKLLDRIIGNGKTQWVLDPTLLISRSEWEMLCEDNPYKEKHYVFAYLLGSNTKQRELVTEWAKKHNKTIICIPYLLGHYRSCDKLFGDIRRSNVTPNLWLSLIRDADCVFTDSFHAAVFSSIFHTPFYVFKRSKDSSKHSMNSRIYSLMQLFNTGDRIIDNNDDILSFPPMGSIDFSKIDKNVEIERSKSISFLKNAIEE